MGAVRAFFSGRPGLVACVLALALLMKAWVPVGYMPVIANGAVVLLPCSGHGVMDAPMATDTHHDSTGHIMHDMAGMHHDVGMADDMAGDHAQHNAGHKHSGGEKHADMPCVFSGLSAPVLAGADPLLLAAAIAFLFVAALVARAQLPLRRIFFLRPPAQAPPPAIF